MQPANVFPGSMRPRSGMIVRSEVTLEPGTVLYKLGNRFVRGTRKSDQEVVATSWWIGQADYEEIRRRARLAGARLDEVWRQYGAIARQWGGSGDLLVRAEVRQPLRGFVGPGTVIDLRDRGAGDDQPLWMPPAYVTQIYIPNLGRGDAASGRSVAQAALGRVELTLLPF